ncbi:MAG: addiction module protein [Chthoniobacteraceae bacterium]
MNKSTIERDLMVTIARRHGYTTAMTADDLRTLPLAEKFQLMDALWQELRERFDRMDLTESQKALLDCRRAAVERGDSRLHDWDAVKASIGRA